MQFSHSFSALDVEGTSPLLSALSSALSATTRRDLGGGLFELPNGDLAWSSSPATPKASGERRSRGGEAPLGIKRNFSDIGADQAAKASGQGDGSSKKTSRKKETAEQAADRLRLEYRERFADQREAARLMWSAAEPEADGKKRPKGVTLCGWTMRYGVNAVTVRRVTRPDGPVRSYLHGLTQCDLGWLCPICTARKMQEPRERVNAVLSHGRRAGWRMIMVTLTARHDADMPLARLLAQLKQASDDLKSTYSWKQANKRMVGAARALEITHSAVNGWHPHFHMILVFPAEMTQAEAEAMAERMRGDWMNQLELQGLTGNEHAFHVQGAAAAGNYLTKWGAASELTLGYAKAGRKGSRTPWQMLRDSRDGDHEAGQLWLEYARCIKGSNIIRFTKGLNTAAKEELARLEEARQEKIAAGLIKDEVEHEVDLTAIMEDVWKERGRHRRVLLKEAAAARTRKDAEKAVWQALHGAQTDKDLLAVDELIEDDEDVGAHDDPERHLDAIKAARRAAHAAAVADAADAWESLSELEQSGVDKPPSG